MSIDGDWRSIRYEDKYDWDQIPRPVEPIPLELRRWLLLPKDDYVLTANLQARPFSDNSIQTLNSINKRLEAIRVKLSFWGLHKRTNLLIYSFQALQDKATVKVKNPWYNFILVWSLGDYTPEEWLHKCLWCARISEQYYGQKGIYMNMRKRSQRWYAKHKGKSKRRRSTPLKSSDGESSQEQTFQKLKKE